MAAQIELVRGADFLADASEVSLYDYEDGFSLRRNGWNRSVAGIDDRFTSEAMSLAVKATSHDDLADKLQLIDQKARETSWYNDELAERYGVWLRCKMENESYPYQALLLDLRGHIGESLHDPPASPGNLLKSYTLALERMPYWEATEHLTFSTTAIGALGGTYDYGAAHRAIGGDVPARIAKYKVRTYSPSWPLTEVWVGFRTDRFGTRGNFVPVWECEDGTVGTDTTGGVADSDASDGAKVQCDFATNEDMANRVTVKADDITTNYSDQRGRFTVLLRAKVGASTICRTRLLDGFYEADDWRTRSRVQISSTDWRLYQLGEVTIPPVRGKTLPDSLARYSLRVEAERTSGSNDLHLDCLVLIPVAEGSVYFDGAKMAANYETYVYTHPDGTREGETMYGNYPIASLAVSGGNFWLPLGEGSVVFAAQRDEDGHNLTDVCTHTFHYYKRWRSLRGAD